MLATPSSLCGQQARGKREAVLVNVSATATRQVATALDLLAAEQWQPALELLTDLQQRQPDDLVEVEPRRFLRAGLVAELLRLQLAANPRDSGPPIARNRVVVPLAEQAARAWETGDLDGAARLWSLLLRPASETISAAAPWSPPHPRPFDTGAAPAAPITVTPSNVTPESATLTAADLLARLALVEIMQGDKVAAARAIERLAAVEPPHVGSIAGRDGLLATTLSEVLEESQAWRLDASRDRHFRSVRIPAGNNASPSAVRSEVVAWRIAVQPCDVAATAAGTSPFRHPPARLESIPAVNGAAVFVQDAHGIRAIDIALGRPLWPTGAPDDDGMIYRDPQPDDTELTRPVRGRRLYRPAIDGGRLIAVTGPHLGYASPREPRAIFSSLTCLDVDRQEGKLLWSVTAETLLTQANWRFSGSPIAADDRVFVPLRRSEPTPMLGVACVDARDGRLLWNREVCTLLEDVPPTIHVATADQLRFGEGQVFISGDFGATASLGAERGQIDWITQDPPLAWFDAADREQPAAADHPGLLHRAAWYGVTHDDQTVQALDAITGAILWQTPLRGKLRQVVGVQGGVLVVAGDFVWGLDSDSGHPLWRFGYDDPAGAIHGQATIAGRHCLWCTREELFTIDLVTGLAVRRLPLRAGWGIDTGHLITAGDQLLLSSDLETICLRPARTQEPQPE
ncbi:MAG: PQQ-binding-like beta-propeller repeat protein [Planctomycetaceae bacterium]